MEMYSSNKETPIVNPSNPFEGLTTQQIEQKFIARYTAYIQSPTHELQYMTNVLKSNLSLEEKLAQLDGEVLKKLISTKIKNLGAPTIEVSGISSDNLIRGFYKLKGDSEANKTASEYHKVPSIREAKQEWDQIVPNRDAGSVYISKERDPVVLPHEKVHQSVNGLEYVTPKTQQYLAVISNELLPKYLDGVTDTSDIAFITHVLDPYEMYVTAILFRRIMEEFGCMKIEKKNSLALDAPDGEVVEYKSIVQGNLDSMLEKLRGFYEKVCIGYTLSFPFTNMIFALGLFSKISRRKRVKSLEYRSENRLLYASKGNSISG